MTIQLSRTIGAIRSITWLIRTRGVILVASTTPMVSSTLHSRSKWGIGIQLFPSSTSPIPSTAQSERARRPHSSAKSEAQSLRTLRFVSVKFLVSPTKTNTVMSTFRLCITPFYDAIFEDIWQQSPFWGLSKGHATLQYVVVLWFNQDPSSCGHQSIRSSCWWFFGFQWRHSASLQLKSRDAEVVADMMILCSFQWGKAKMWQRLYATASLQNTYVYSITKFGIVLCFSGWKG